LSKYLGLINLAIAFLNFAAGYLPPAGSLVIGHPSNLEDTCYLSDLSVLSLIHKFIRCPFTLSRIFARLSETLGSMKEYFVPSTPNAKRSLGNKYVSAEPDINSIIMEARKYKEMLDKEEPRLLKHLLHPLPLQKKVLIWINL